MHHFVIELHTCVHFSCTNGALRDMGLLDCVIFATGLLQVYGRPQEYVPRCDQHVLLHPVDNNICMLRCLLWSSVLENPGNCGINESHDKRQWRVFPQTAQLQPSRKDYVLFCPGFLESVVCLHCLLHMVLPAGASRMAAWRQCVSM